MDKSRTTARGLEVLVHGSPIGAENVTAATVYFWNAGRAPIRKDEVLTPYTIEVGGSSSVAVLDAEIVKQTRDVCGFSLAQIQPPANEVNLFFDLLEESDGAAIQVIFAGDPNTEIRVSGISVGAKTPRKVDLTQLIFKNALTTQRSWESCSSLKAS